MDGDAESCTQRESGPSCESIACVLAPPHFPLSCAPQISPTSDDSFVPPLTGVRGEGGEEGGEAGSRHALGEWGCRGVRDGSQSRCSSSWRAGGGVCGRPLPVGVEASDLLDGAAVEAWQDLERPCDGGAEVVGGVVGLSPAAPLGALLLPVLHPALVGRAGGELEGGEGGRAEGAAEGGGRPSSMW